MKYIRQLSFFIVYSLFIIHYSFSQDVHFSQWSNTPLILNPAMTGVFDGKLRFSNDYRSQWVGLTQAYTTIHASLDLPIGRSYYKKEYFGFGVVVIQDNAGSSPLKNTTALASLSYTAPLDEEDNYISVGFQGGINQISFDASKATWGSQWNGDQQDASFGAGSIPAFEKSQISAPDINAGVLWHYEPDQNNRVYFGGSAYHISGQSLSLYSSNNSPIERRYNAMAGGQKSLNQDNSTWLIPEALFMLQGDQKEITAGAAIKNKVQFKSKYTSYKKEVLYSFGIYHRLQDALIFVACFEYNNFTLGFSYDYTVSDLRKYAGSGNAIEITLAIFNPIKKGERARNYNKSPKFY